MKNVIGFCFGVCVELICLPLYLLAGVLGYFFVLNGREKSGSPVVFVHGWMTQTPLYYFLVRFLEKAGFRVYVTNFGLQAGDYLDLAKDLKAYLEKHDLRDVVLVGTSGGAIISLAYLQKHDGWSRARKLIAIGGPFFGSPLAFLAFFSKAGRQMMVSSNFLAELMGDEIRNKDRIVCIQARFDELVPQKSSRIPGVRCEALDVVGHVHLQAFSRKTFKAIVEHAST